MRQVAELGMRAQMTSFPRLKDLFICKDNRKRKIMQQILVLLNNIRARKGGIEQGKNAYMSALNINANEYFLNQNYNFLLIKS